MFGVCVVVCPPLKMVHPLLRKNPGSDLASLFIIAIIDLIYLLFFQNFTCNS